MSWIKKVLGIEKLERLNAEMAQSEEEQDQAAAEYRAINIELIRTMAGQNGIQMAQCSSCQAWYIKSRGPWCGCQ